MGIQRLSDKKVRHISEQVGMEFTKCGTWGDPAWVECVDCEDVHWSVNRKTGEAQRTENPFHWSSCRGA